MGSERKLETEKSLANTRDYESGSSEGPEVHVDAYERSKAHAGDEYMEYRTMGWMQAAALITAETVALGILSFPSVFMRLGMFAGVFVTVCLALLSWQTGYVLVDFKIRHPEVMNFPDAFYVVAGKRGYVVVGIALVVKNVLSIGSHSVSGSIAFDTMTNHATCNVVWALVIAIISFLLAIPRTFATVSWIGLISVVSILAACFITMIAVGVQDPSALVPPGGEPIHWYAFHNSGFINIINAITNIIFAYAGHVAIFTFCSEMREPKQFKRSLAFVQIFSTTFYIIVGAVVYRFGGQYTTSPALTMGSRPVKITAYAVSLLSIIISGVVASYIGGKFVYHALFRDTKHLTSRSYRSWGYWLCVMGTLWGLAFIVAELIPFFSDLLSLISSILTIWFTYGFSGILFFYDNRPTSQTKHMSGGFFSSWRNGLYTMLNAFVILFTCVFMPLGIYSSVKSIVDNYSSGDTYGRPFGCG